MKVFNDEQWKDLRQCIVDMADLGFALNLCDVGEVVESFILYNGLDKAKVI